MYKSSGQSLKRLGLMNKMIYIVVSSIIPMVLVISILTKGWFNYAILFVYFTLWVIAIAAYIIYSRYLEKHLEIIGELDVNLGMIKKSIGDFHKQYDYSKILGIEVKPHSRRIFLPSNSDGSQTYIVTIDYQAMPKEQFVISSQSIDDSPLNFLETVKWVEKYLKIQLLKQKR